jgi:hypothetical protein
MDRLGVFWTVKRKLLKLWLVILTVVLGLLAVWQHYDFFWPWREDTNSVAALKKQRLRPIQLGPVRCIGLYARLPDHPSVKLERAEFSSPATITPGSLLEVRAYTNAPVRNCRVEMTVYASPPGQYPDAESVFFAAIREDTLYMWDDGKNGDTTARDGEWFGALTVDFDRDCVFSGMACIYFDNYNRQYCPIQNLVRLDAPGDSPLTEGTPHE